MELMVRNGDYVNDGAGGFLRAEGTDELLQRVLWKLSIPRGSFPLLPALGSELHRLGRAKPAERAGLARQYVAQALSDEAELSVAGVEPVSRGRTDGRAGLAGRGAPPDTWDGRRMTG